MGASGEVPNDDFTRDIARTATSQSSLHSVDEDQVLVALPNGRYDVWVDELEHEDELGTFESRLRIVRV